MTISARALVVPFDAHDTLGNESNVSADSRSATQLRLVISETDDGAPGAPGQQVITIQASNWLRIVLYFAGSNDGPHADLPAEIHLPVQLDEGRRIVAVDLDSAEAELAPYRDVAVAWWKETESPLADVRQIGGLPGDAVRGVKGLLKAWRRGVSDLREPVAADADEVEQSRRTANALRYTLERNPKQLAKIRASALQAGPMMVDGVRQGTRTVGDFETWLQFQATSGAITDDEASAWRAQADS